MTLDQFIAKYSGIRVGDGQCGTLVRQYWTDVDQTNPPSYEDSKDYWPNPVPGYEKITSDPQPGDIAIYDGHGDFPEGHSAIYVGNGQVFEQNADPDGSGAHIYTRANTYLLGYLRKQGEDMQLTEDQFYMQFRLEAMREPTQEEASNPQYRDSVFLSETLWNNGGQARYENRANTYVPVTTTLYEKKG